MIYKVEVEGGKSWVTTMIVRLSPEVQKKRANSWKSRKRFLWEIKTSVVVNMKMKNKLNHHRPEIFSAGNGWNRQSKNLFLVEWISQQGKIYHPAHGGGMQACKKIYKMEKDEREWCFNGNMNRCIVGVVFYAISHVLSSMPPFLSRVL